MKGGSMIGVNRRRYMGGKSLPYDAEIEYIGSNSSAPAIYQYIDTGIVPTTGYQIHIKLGPITTYPAGQSSLFIQAWAIRCFFIQVASDAPNQIYWHGMNPSAYHELNSEGVNDVVCGNGFIIVNGTTYTSSNYLTNTSKTIILFCNDSGRRSVYNLYLFEVIYNGVVIAQFKPVRVGSEGCLYETVSKQIFHNNGTGSFTLGPDKIGGGKCLIINMLCGYSVERRAA